MSEPDPTPTARHTARSTRQGNAQLQRLLDLSGDDWEMTGIDPEGFDLRPGLRTARLSFEQRVRDAAAARAELDALVEQARVRLADAS